MSIFLPIHLTVCLSDFATTMSFKSIPEQLLLVHLQSSYMAYTSLTRTQTVWLHFKLFHSLDSFVDKFMIFFLFFPENRIWHFMQIVSNGWRQFEWNIKTCFLGKIRKHFNMLSAENFIQSAEHSRTWSIFLCRMTLPLFTSQTHAGATPPSEEFLCLEFIC